MAEKHVFSAGIIVVSDRIYYKEVEDVSGDMCRLLLEDKGFIVRYYNVMPNDETLIERSIRECLDSADVCITIGGTGPTPRDKTIEVATRLAEKTLPGFGEIFRHETYMKKGLTKALPTRTELFTVRDRLLLCLPGSPDAIELGMSLFLKAADHLIDEVKRLSGPHKSI